MTTQTLLAHVVSQFAPRQWENVATEALHFLLARPGAADAVGHVLAPSGFTLPSGLSWRTQAVDPNDSSRPDLVADDAAGRHVLILEAKFWAGLTPNQPRGYLERQARQFPDSNSQSVLVFLAPQQRIELLAAELQSRLEGVPTEMRGALPVLVYGEQLVVLVSWGQMLSALEGAFASRGDQEAARDLAQLRGLCDRADSEAVLPLAVEDVDPERGMRVYQFCDLVDRATDRLVRDGVVDTKRLKATGAKGWYGRYVHVPSGQVFLFYVGARRWGSTYPSPWWLRFWQTDDALVRGLRGLVARGVVAHVEVTSTSCYVALKPPLGVEGDRIVDGLSEAVAAVCSSLPVLEGAPVPAEAVADAAGGLTVTAE